MKVKELLRQLSLMPQDTEVVFENDEGDWIDIEALDREVGDDKIVYVVLKEVNI